LEFLNTGITVARPIVLNFDTRVVVNGTDSGTISGTIASGPGNAKLVKGGTGTLALSGSGSGLTGGLTLNSGTLVLDFSSNTALKMANTGQLVLNGGVLNLKANTTTAVTQNAGST